MADLYDAGDALEYVLGKIAESGRFDSAQIEQVRQIAAVVQQQDLKFMDALDDDQVYDDDDAYDAIVEGAIASLGDELTDELLVAEVADAYLEYHEDYLEAHGLVTWD